MKKWYLTRGWVCLVLVLNLPLAERAVGAEKKPSAATQSSRLTVKAYMAKIEKFKSSSASMEPQEAAKQWLALVDDFLKITTTSFEVAEKTDHLTNSCYQVMSALPPSAMWEAIVAELKARHEAQPKEVKPLALWMLLSVLQNDMVGWDAARSKLVSLVKESKKLSDNAKATYLEQIQSLEDGVVELCGNPQIQAESFDKKWASWSDSSEPVPFVTVPNLASAWAPEKVFEVLAKTFQASESSYISDAPTLEMAKYGFLKHPKYVTKPSWYWVSEPHDQAIYETMDGLFGDEGDPSAKLAAFGPYLLGWIESGELAKAREKFSQMMRVSGDDLDLGFMSDAVKTHPSKALFEFLHEELKANPNLPWWGEFTDLALRINERVPAMERFMQTRDLEGLDESVALIVELCYTKLLSSVGHMDSGAERLAQVLKDYKSSELMDVSLGLQLATMGRLMKEASWEKAGLDFIQQTWKAELDAEFAWDKPKHDAVIAVIQSGQMKVAEAYLERVIQHLVKGKEEGLDQEAVPRLLSLLAYLQLKTDRFEEVVQLFDQSAHWGVNDLRHVEVPAILGHSVQGILVEALIKTDRKMVAERIVEERLRQKPNQDEAYRWWVELKGKEAIGTFQVLHAKHPHLAKPLSWIAYVQQSHDEDASASLQQGLALDPMDELAIATQADALEKEAKLLVSENVPGAVDEPLQQKQIAWLEEAKRLRLKVAAQLLGREAEEVYDVNLVYEALQRFERALEMDPDNAELAARAGLAAATIGETERAAGHFEQAFRLLPAGLSRFESVAQTQLLEALFSEPLALKMGAQVLGKAVEPNSAALAYVQARLKLGQHDVKGALEDLERAMKLDPTWAMPYKQALELEQVWERLTFRQFLEFADSEGRIHAPFATKLEAWRVAFAKLDRWDHVGGFSALSDMTDLKRLWDTILELAPSFEPSTLLEPLYPLSGSLEAYLAENPESQLSEELTPLMPSQEQLYEVFGEHPRVSTVAASLLQLSADKF